MEKQWKESEVVWLHFSDTVMSSLFFLVYAFSQKSKMTYPPWNWEKEILGELAKTPIAMGEL